jgi:hypothetical protein
MSFAAVHESGCGTSQQSLRRTSALNLRPVPGHCGRSWPCGLRRLARVLFELALAGRLERHGNALVSLM